jgi:ESCRT-II complex subunit VPS22
MQRGRHGTAAVLAREKRAAALREQGRAHNAELAVQMKAQLETFEQELERYAVLHRDDIQRDPVLRAKFHEMCNRLGVDPLTSRKGIWTKVLGIGDFYYELGVRIIQICVATRPINGGILSMSELLRLLHTRSHSSVRARSGDGNPSTSRQVVSADDIERAVKKLSVLGSGFCIVDIGRHDKVIRSVPVELSPDHTTVLNLCGATGYVTRSVIKRQLLWDDDRIADSLDFLLRKELAWLDEQSADGKAYWILGLVAGSGEQVE